MIRVPFSRLGVQLYRKCEDLVNASKSLAAPSWMVISASVLVIFAIWLGLNGFAGAPSASMTESQRFVAENFNVYRTGEGTVIADPIYPNEESEMGVAEIRYRLVSPELYDFQERPVPVLRQDALKKGDEVKVESFHNPKAWRQEHVVLARPAK